MPFSPVKSDPWRKSLRRIRTAFQLWSEAFWKDLEEVADKMHHETGGVEICDECLTMIRETNKRLYGKP